MIEMAGGARGGTSEKRPMVIALRQTGDRRLALSPETETAHSTSSGPARERGVIGSG